MLDVALEYLDRGMSVIPLTPQDKTPHMALLPRNADRATWKEFQERHPTQEEVISILALEGGIYEEFKEEYIENKKSLGRSTKVEFIACDIKNKKNARTNTGSVRGNSGMRRMRRNKKMF